MNQPNYQQRNTRVVHTVESICAVVALSFVIYQRSMDELKLKVGNNDPVVDRTIFLGKYFGYDTNFDGSLDIVLRYRPILGGRIDQAIIPSPPYDLMQKKYHESRNELNYGSHHELHHELTNTNK